MKTTYFQPFAFLLVGFLAIDVSAEKAMPVAPAHPLPPATAKAVPVADAAAPAAVTTSPTKPGKTVPPKLLSASAQTMVDRLRLSALIGDGPKMLIGVVDATTSNAFLLHLGDSVYGYEVVAADYKAETITLRKAKDEFMLRLKEDTNAVPVTAMGETGMGIQPATRKIKTLEEFLAEHPNATTPTEIKFDFPTNDLPVRTFEDFIKDHPEMAGVSNYVAEGLGPGIDTALPPEITNDVSTPDPGQYGLGPGIEKALNDMPADQRPKVEDLAPGKVKSYEEFIKENEWRFKQQDGSQPATTSAPAIN